MASGVDVEVEEEENAGRAKERRRAAPAGHRHSNKPLSLLLQDSDSSTVDCGAVVDWLSLDNSCRSSACLPVLALALVSLGLSPDNASTT